MTMRAVRRYGQKITHAADVVAVHHTTIDDERVMVALDVEFAVCGVAMHGRGPVEIAPQMVSSIACDDCRQKIGVRRQRGWTG